MTTTRTLSLSALRAKSTLPMQTSPSTLPATRITNRSLNPWPKSISVGTRASEQPTTTAKGALLGHLALRAHHAHFQAVARHDVARLALAGRAGAAALHPAREHAVAVLQDSRRASRHRWAAAWPTDSWGRSGRCSRSCSCSVRLYRIRRGLRAVRPRRNRVLVGKSRSSSCIRPVTSPTCSIQS